MVHHLNKGPVKGTLLVKDRLSKKSLAASGGSSFVPLNMRKRLNNFSYRHGPYSYSLIHLDVVVLDAEIRATKQLQKYSVGWQVMQISERSSLLEAIPTKGLLSEKCENVLLRPRHDSSISNWCKSFFFFFWLEEFFSLEMVLLLFWTTNFA